MFVAGLILFFSSTIYDQYNISRVFCNNDLLFLSNHPSPSDTEIDGNEELAAFCTNGTGTVNDPYIIEGLILDVYNDGIRVENTDVHLAIRNCTISARHPPEYEHSAGIRLINCSNINISINNISEKATGVSCFKSEQINIFNNTFNGILVSGINLAESSNILLKYNYMDGYGIRVRDVVSLTIDKSNKVNGKSVVYYENKIGLEISDCFDVGQVILVQCAEMVVKNLDISEVYAAIYLENSSGNTIQGNICQKNYVGIFLRNSQDNSIINNLCSKNLENGIYLTNSNENKIKRNECSENSYGIYLSHSNLNVVRNNLCTNNSSDGIRLIISDDNELKWNKIKGNEQNGLFLWISDRNLIKRNRIEENVEEQIYLDDSDDNRINRNSTLEIFGQIAFISIFVSIFFFVTIKFYRNRRFKF